MKDVLQRALISGTLAAAAVTVAASIASRRETGSYPAALNATSHFLWEEHAAEQDDYSWKYTATGLATNWGASVFWAIFYEALRPRDPVQESSPVVVVSARHEDRVRTVRRAASEKRGEPSKVDGG